MTKYTKHFSIEEFDETEVPAEEYSLSNVTMYVYRSNGTERTYFIDHLTGNFIKGVHPTKSVCQSYKQTGK